jgi:hypothetical protein
MDKQRLLKLADLLEADAARSDGVKFNLHDVVRVGRRPENGIVKPDCGTYACAMGLAAISGAFEDEGLGYRFGVFGFDVTLWGEPKPWANAASKFFDLAMHEVDFLFTPASYQHTTGAEAERMVASRVRDMAAGELVAPLEWPWVPHSDDAVL